MIKDFNVMRSNLTNIMGTIVLIMSYLIKDIDEDSIYIKKDICNYYEKDPSKLMVVVNSNVGKFYIVYKQYQELTIILSNKFCDKILYDILNMRSDIVKIINRPDFKLLMRYGALNKIVLIFSDIDNKYTPNSIELDRLCYDNKIDRSSIEIYDDHMCGVVNLADNLRNMHNFNKKCKFKITSEDFKNNTISIEEID